jgi:hypothetical protein
MHGATLAIAAAIATTAGAAYAVEQYHPWATQVVETTNTATLCRNVEYLTTLGYSNEEAVVITLSESEDIAHPLVCQ